ncbi:Uncharacterised protein [Vibrio cholerae]|nr:Uncharacterised protein [Vibrio cholerae]
MSQRGLTHQRGLTLYSAQFPNVIHVVADTAVGAEFAH